MRAIAGLLVALAGCWTGGDTPVIPPSAVAPPVQSARPIKLRLERTACNGSCPVYTVVIHGDGRVAWTGHDNVLAAGARSGRVTERELGELEREIEAARFFERDEYGHLPMRPECTTSNGTTSCTMGGSFSFCTDTSHSIITVRVKARTHSVDSSNCDVDVELLRLEKLVNRVANIQAWVGGDDE